MDLTWEILNRVGGLAVFGIAFLSFAYWVTQVQPRNAERKAAERAAKRDGR